VRLWGDGRAGARLGASKDRSKQCRRTKILDANENKMRNVDDVDGRDSRRS
jgi:hypothetical protein